MYGKNTLICAIMQPTFLPWAGYFNLISKVDDFVFLDNVQLEKQSWQSRNRLLISSKVNWVSVPIQHIDLKQTIAQTLIVDNKRWKKKLARSFEQSYGRHPYFDDAKKIFDIVIKSTESSLSALNISVIQEISKCLDLSPRFHVASELGVGGERTERLISICHKLKAKDYLSAIGAADYLVEDKFEEKSNLKLRFQNYTPDVYFQKETTEFVSHLSILDVIANLGWSATREYVVCGILK